MTIAKTLSLVSVGYDNKTVKADYVWKTRVAKTPEGKIPEDRVWYGWHSTFATMII